MNLRKLMLLLCLVLFAGCSGYSVTGGPGKTVRAPIENDVSDINGLREVNSLLVAPLVLEQDVAQNVVGSEEGLYDTVVSALRTEVGIDVYPVKGDKKIIAESGMYPHSRWLTEAAQVGADGILVMRIHTYNRRRGSAMGADESASVGFLMSIYTTGGDTEVWRASYHVQDQAVAENLFRFGKTSAGLNSAEKLYEKGVNNTIQDFAAKRISAFSR